MALPGDLIVKYNAQQNAQLLQAVEEACRKFRPDLWEQYFPTKYRYGHSPDIDTADYEPVSGSLVAGTIDDVGRNSYTLTRGQRIARCMGILVNVGYTTNDATTRGNISTVLATLM